MNNNSTGTDGFTARWVSSLAILFMLLFISTTTLAENKRTRANKKDATSYCQNYKKKTGVTCHIKKCLARVGLRKIKRFSRKFSRAYCVYISKADKKKQKKKKKASSPTRTRVMYWNNKLVHSPRFFTRLPEGMPAVRMPKGFKGCGKGKDGKPHDLVALKRAWGRAHYSVWRMHTIMNYMAGLSEQKRKAAWTRAVKGYTRYTPALWFGPYKKKHFVTVRKAIATVWKRFHKKTFKVMCRRRAKGGAHPCYIKRIKTKRPASANHIVLGRINFCHRFFDEKSEWDQMRIVVHEVFHHVRLNNGLYVVDNHTHCHKGKCETRPFYGKDRAIHLASGNKRHVRLALRNNDNYAHFILRIGQASLEGKLNRFPAK